MDFGVDVTPIWGRFGVDLGSSVVVLDHNSVPSKCPGGARAALQSAIAMSYSLASSSRGAPQPSKLDTDSRGAPQPEGRGTQFSEAQTVQFKVGSFNFGAQQSM